MSATEFDNALQAIVSSPKGGIPSGTKIKEVASLCVNNVQSESLLVQKLYLYFKKAPSTHKIGLLYIVDLILRDFLSNAKKRGEDQWPSPPAGTHMAGFNRLKELLPRFLDDVLQSVTEDQKEKIRKLIDIWERGNILTPDFLAPFKAQLNNPSPENGSTTPVGSPPPNLLSMLSGRQPQAPPPAPAPTNNSSNAASLLQALANIAKTNQTAAPTPAPTIATAPAPAIPAQPTIPGMPFAFPQFQQTSTPTPPPPVPAPAPAPAPAANSIANLSAILGNLGKVTPPQAAAPPPPPPPQIPQLPQLHQISQYSTPTPPVPAAPAVDPNLQAQQLALLQLLIAQPQLAATLGSNPTLAALLGGGAAAPQPAQPPAIPSWQQQAQQERDPRERARYSPPPRSPPHRINRFRSRSRSPVAGNKRPGSPISFRRRSPVYGEYGKDNDDSQQNQFQQRGRGGGRGKGNQFRRGSPKYDRPRSKSPQRTAVPATGVNAYVNAPPAIPKNIERDPTIGPDKIKVFSRTLFVGGVANVEESVLREMFERFGRVQSCIVNREKRHAFIKMFTREDAVKAKEGMTTYRTGDLTIRTRWGVGFGPRDCSDYETGVSIVPIERLTDADRRWVVSADYGGTGGIPLEGGMCIEEPDIEIGQGVSSKAISKRRPADHHTGQQGGGGGGHHDGHGGGKHHFGGAGGGGFNRRHEPHVTNEPGIGVPPPTPGFGGGFPINLPGFMVPGQRPPGM